MNPFTHQWKWDFRRIRVSWILWLLLLGLSLVLRFKALFRDPYSSTLPQLTTSLLPVVLYVFGSLLVARIMYATPFAGPSAHWKTRPLPRASLFREKTLFILLLIWLPAMIGIMAFGALVVRDGVFLATTALVYGSSLFAVLFLTALLSSLCGRITSFIGWAAAFIGLAVVARTLARIVQGWFGLSPVLELGPGSHPGSPETTFLVALLVFMLTVLVGWFTGALRCRPKAAIALAASGLVVLMSANWIWRVSFGTSSPLPDQDLVIEVLDENQELSGSQVRFTPHLALTLPSDHLVVVRHQISVTLDRAGTNNDPRRKGKVMENHLFDLATRAYPLGTRVLDGSEHRQSVAFIDEVPDDEPCTFSGSFSAYVLKWNRLASLPAEDGATTRLPGLGKAVLTRLRDSASSFEFRVTSVGLNRMSHAERFSPGLYSASRFLFTLSHPEGHTVVLPGDGRPISRHSGPTGLESVTYTFHATKASIREALGHDASRGDLADLSIHIFDLTPVSTATGSFHRENWIPYPIRRPLEDGNSQTNPAWVKVRLPDHPGPEQVDRFLDDLIYGIPNRIDNKLYAEVQQCFDSLGGEHLDQLIARLPVIHYARIFAFRTIRKHATEDHLPALLAALPDEPLLAGILRERGWGQAGLPILKEHLQKHIPFDSHAGRSIVVLVAQDQDPATYDDLRWHFIHAGTGHSAMIHALSTCPGFPLDEAIESAWARARAGLAVQPGELCFHVLRHGDPEALRHSIAELLRKPDHPMRDLLDQAVDQPAGVELIPWLHSHFDALEFDPARRVFLLPPGSG